MQKVLTLNYGDSDDRKEHAKLKDRLKKQNRRANEEYRALERERNAEAMRRKRQNAEWRRYEQARNTMAKRIKREDPVEREKERIRNAEAMRIRRMDAGMRERERVKNAEYMRRRRQNEEFRKMERERDMLSKRMRRANIEKAPRGKRDAMEQYVKMSSLFQLYVKQIKSEGDTLVDITSQNDDDQFQETVMPFSANFDQIQSMLPQLSCPDFAFGADVRPDDAPITKLESIVDLIPSNVKDKINGLNEINIVPVPRIKLKRDPCKGNCTESEVSEIKHESMGLDDN